MKPAFSRVLAVPIAVVALSVLAAPAGSTHWWGGYHWARTSSPFTLSLGSNLTTSWTPYLRTTAADWSKSNVLDTVVATGRTTKGRCAPTGGRVEVCNSTYGQNGWIGIAQVWTYDRHITSGTVRMNDTYFNRPWYNTPAWKNHVMCQEVGHTLGLAHQDESGAHLGTCMDYASNPEGSQHPDDHDYAQLESLYSHLDSTTTVASSSSVSARMRAQEAREWGRAIRYEARTGRPDLFERRLSSSQRVYTFVTWAE